MIALKSALAVVLVAMIGLACASDVVDTTDATFDEVVASSEMVLMEFYAPWCGHCKKLAPEWETAATQLKGKVVLAKIDATAEPKNAQTYDVKGYPTIKVFRDGKVSGDYEGGRTADTIVQWVKANSGPAVVVAETADAVEAIKSENPVVIVCSAAADSEDLKTFTAVANAKRSAAVYVSAPGVGSGIVAYKKFDEPTEEFSGEVTEEALTTFVSSVVMRVFDEIGPENYKSYMDRGLPMAWLFVTPGADATEPAKEIAAAVAKSAKGKVSFVWIDAAKYGGMAQRLGLKGDKFPSFAIDKDGTHYVFDESTEITADALQKFSDDFLAGTLPQTVRSEAEPAEHTVDGLTTVVGNTFEQLITNAEQDVLIEFYAPWCGHCKSLAPVYAKVAAAAKDQPITIAQIDATANDFPQKTFPVQGFPTIFFKPKGGEPKNYEGSRDFDGFAKFLKEHASITISE